MMKITPTFTPTAVFAGQFWPGASGSGLSQGLQALGWSVQEADHLYFGSGYNRNIIIRALDRLSRNIRSASYQRYILDLCETIRPDIFITIKGVDISASLLRKIRAIGIKTVMYYPDVHFSHPGVSEDSFPEYDLFATTKTFHLSYLRNALGHDKVAYVPHGYTPSVHRSLIPPTGRFPPCSDVIYVGTHSAFKQDWLESLAELNPGLTMRVLGSGWESAARTGALKRHELGGARFGVAYAQAIQSAKINIALHMGPTSSGWSDRVSTRSFEIPACGGFMIHEDNDEIREFFSVGDEIDVFSSHEELSDKVRYYLDHDAARRRMSARAAKRVLRYSYTERAAEILMALDTATPSSSGRGRV